MRNIRSVVTPTDPILSIQYSRRPSGIHYTAFMQLCFFCRLYSLAKKPWEWYNYRESQARFCLVCRSQTLDELVTTFNLVCIADHSGENQEPAAKNIMVMFVYKQTITVHSGLSEMEMPNRISLTIAFGVSLNVPFTQQLTVAFRILTGVKHIFSYQKQ